MPSPIHEASPIDGPSREKLDIIVIGAGAMGGLFGGLLAESGQDVRLIDIAGAHLSALMEHGLRLETDRGSRTVRIPAGTAGMFDAACELAIMFTKGHATEMALRAARHLIPPSAWVLTVQNGLGNVEVIRRVLPQARIAFGMTSLPADLKGPGHVSAHGSGAVRIWHAGPVAAGIHVIADALAQAGMDCLADPLVEVAIWEKVAFNAAMNSISAVTRLSVGQIGDSAAGRELVAGASGEALRVAAAKGIAVDPERLRQMIEMAFADHRDHLPSMLQDIVAGRRTEIETINGAIIAAGQAVGCATPILQALRDLVRLLEGAAAVVV